MSWWELRAYLISDSFKKQNDLVQRLSNTCTLGILEMDLGAMCGWVGTEHCYTACCAAIKVLPAWPDAGGGESSHAVVATTPHLAACLPPPPPREWGYTALRLAARGVQ